MKTTVAQYSSPARVLRYSGVIRPRIESALGFRVSGKLMERLVNTGDRVEQGQVLARIDPVDLKLAEAAQQANVDAAKTRLAVAKSALERSKRLLASNFTSQAAYDSAKLEVDSAQGALEAAEAQLRQNANQVSYAELRANAAGVITAVNAEPGQVVSTGQAVVTMAETEEVEVAVAVPENELASIRVGAPATATLWADASVSAEGRIREIAGAADSATRTYAVRIGLPSPPPQMRLGMTAAVLLKTPAKPELKAPLTALAQIDGKPVLWIVDPATNTVAPREVTLGDLADDGVRVLSNLTEGEIIVSAGVQFLTPGQQVRIAAPSNPSIAERR
ncbi:MAG: efflux RND transporter periplasmic adaptor subunit [Hyphomicrobiales bacterium]|nr:efflux RND transporter periplasmic adaptor subunit [Hyphomicrobiales bacterium]